MYLAVASLSYSLVRLSASAVKLLKGFVEEATPVDNFWYLDGELGFWDMDLFGNLAIELGNSEEDFGTVDLGLDKHEGVLGSLIVC